VISTTETLFGGLLAVALIFFIARRLALSTYWSGILGAVLTFLAYLAYSAGQWPGIDVLAIHLVVFTATAAMLGIFSSLRQAKSKMHWAPKLIIAFFMLLVLINAALLSIATHGLPDNLSAWLLPQKNGQKLHTGFSGAVPHDRNKLYEAYQQRNEAQKALGWQVAAHGLDSLQAGRDMDIGVSLRDAAGRPLAAQRVTLDLWRLANRKDDIALPLQPATAAGEYAADITLPAAGRWIALLRIERDADVHETRYSLQVAAP
jgi:nitrogen fixation protein FixH